MDFCSTWKSSRFMDFGNTVDGESVVNFGADSVLCQSQASDLES